MRVPLSWLREYAAVPLGATAHEVAAALVRVGLEEEDFVEPEGSGAIVVGLVESVTPEEHSNDKTIEWCSVRVAPGERDDAVRGIVCGAHNFVAGDLVIVALPGAVLPGGFAIGARQTYGHVSDGMICSLRELGLGDDHTGIIVLTRLGLTGEPGDDVIPLLGLDDPIVDVNVTPDRGYCLSVRGVAREYALSTGSAYRDPADLEVTSLSGAGWPVEVRDEAPVRGIPGCDRYVARVIRGVDPTAASPYWLQHRLTQAGMRPISLTVDVTNYVMLTTGQPLHAFDLAKLRGPIVVRRAREGERLVTLGGADRALLVEDLLITDEDAAGVTRVIALAGLMGGADTEVVDTTTDVVIESAHFAQVSVSRSARRHRLISEAGRRFERGVDPALAPAAAELAVRLLTELGGGTADDVATDLDRRAGATVVGLDPGRVKALVGIDPTATEITDVLVGIGCSYSESADGRLKVEVPSWRPDLEREVDLIEEVARVVGYDRIPSALPRAPAGRGRTQRQRRTKQVSDVLADSGWVEVISYPFTSVATFDAYGLAPDDPRRRAVRLANPMSDELPLMRTMVLDTLLTTLKRNLGRGFRDLALFEVSSVARPEGPSQGPLPQLETGQFPTADELSAFQSAVPPQPRRVALAACGEMSPRGWWGTGRTADWSDPVGAVSLLADRLHVPVVITSDDGHLPWHPGRCARISLADGSLVGHAGELHPRVVAALDLPARTVAAEVDLDVLFRALPGRIVAETVSTFPPVHQDVSLQVGNGVAAAEVEKVLVDGAGDLLERVVLFDVYTGGNLPAGARSLTYRLTFRAPDRTLTDREVSALRDRAVALAGERTGAVAR